MSLQHLNFITSNKNKVAEVKAILGDVVRLQSQSLDLTEIQGAIEDISIDKCRRAAAIVGFSIHFTATFQLLQRAKDWKTGGPVLTEDTCLCFNALKELPGPYIEAFSHSKWFLQALGHEGLNNLLVAYKDKGAQAVCTFAYCSGPGHEPIIFEGRVTGKIVPARGSTNFGWDPIFEYDGETYAEMDKARKNTLSHRAIALSKLKHWLQAQ